MEKERRFRIGRDEACDIPIADASVSRLHAVLTVLEGDRLFLTDCGSTNGTKLVRDGRVIPVQQEFIEPRDAVRFGDVDLSVDEILAVLQERRSLPRLEVEKPPPPPSFPKTGGRPRLVRCECGTVKVKGKTCQNCGT